MNIVTLREQSVEAAFEVIERSDLFALGREKDGECAEMTQMEKIRPYICFEIRSRSFRGIHRSAP